jgi:hypothetical protein
MPSLVAMVNVIPARVKWVQVALTDRALPLLVLKLIHSHFLCVTVSSFPIVPKLSVWVTLIPISGPGSV